MGGARAKRRRTLGRRLRREVRSIRRWSTVFLILWGWFKVDEKRHRSDDSPAA
jgi:hypothetical protein